eukprot:g37902.t1
MSQEHGGRCLPHLTRVPLFQVKKAELERKTLDWEIVELTNKLLDSKTAINKLEELNERYRQDCNLAVQLLKCNKSHFRNHKFADLPFVLQEMVNKHLESSEEVEEGHERSSALGSSDVVPTSVIARVLEKPEPLVLNSAKSSSGNQPLAEDVFVHVDMSSDTNGMKNSGKEGDGVKAEGVKPQNASSEEDLLANWQRMFVEKVAPASERVIAHRTSFSSEMIQEFQNSLGNKIDLAERRLAYSDGEESGHSHSWTVSQDSSLDTDSIDSKVRKGKFLLDYGSEFSHEEEEKLLHAV